MARPPKRRTITGRLFFQPDGAGPRLRRLPGPRGGRSPALRSPGPGGPRRRDRPVVARARGLRARWRRSSRDRGPSMPATRPRVRGTRAPSGPLRWRARRPWGRPDDGACPRAGPDPFVLPTRPALPSPALSVLLLWAVLRLSYPMTISGSPHFGIRPGADGP